MTDRDLACQIYEELRRQIITGELPPGLPIRESAVGQQFGTSRTPVRTALDRLEHEQYLVTTGSNRRYSAALTLRDGQELIAIVEQLESLAARSAAGLPLKQRRLLVRRLRQLNRDFWSSHAEGNQSLSVLDLDRAFHIALVERALGPRLLGLHRIVDLHVERYARRYTDIILGRISDSAKEHDDVIDAIAAGDHAAAAHAVKAHWRGILDSLCDVIARTDERASLDIPQSCSIRTRVRSHTMVSSAAKPPSP